MASGRCFFAFRREENGAHGVGGRVASFQGAKTTCPLIGPFYSHFRIYARKIGGNATSQADCSNRAICRTSPGPWHGGPRLQKIAMHRVAGMTKPRNSRAHGLAAAG